MALRRIDLLAALWVVRFALDARRVVGFFVVEVFRRLRGGAGAAALARREGRRPRLAGRAPVVRSVRCSPHRSFCRERPPALKVIRSVAGFPHTSHTITVCSAIRLLSPGCYGDRSIPEEALPEVGLGLGGFGWAALHQQGEHALDGVLVEGALLG